MKHWIGIDVSSETLDFALLDEHGVLNPRRVSSAIATPLANLRRVCPAGR
jgi:hypothetical protein